MASLYANDGSWRIKIVDGSTYTGRYDTDEAMFMVPSSVAPDDVEGMEHPCGAVVFTTAPNNSVIPRTAPNGSLYIQSSPYTSTGAQRVTVVGPAEAPATQILAPACLTNTSTFITTIFSAGFHPLFPPEIENTNEFFSPVLLGNGALSDTLHTNTNSFFSPALGGGTYAFTPGKITNTNSFAHPTIVGSGRLTDTLFTNSNSFRSPTVQGFAPANPYTADAVHFDGITRIHRTSFVAPVNNFYTFSCWFKIATSAVGALTLWNADPDTNEDAYAQFLTSNHNLKLYYKDDSTTKKTPRMDATVTTNFADGNWHHVLAACDAAGHPLNTSKRVIYIDDVLQSPTLTTNGSGPFDILVGSRPFFVGDDNQGNFFVGDLADFWWDNHTYYVSGSDLPVSFRRKFIDGGGKPVDPVNFPSGNILFSGDHTTFSTNQGTGGTFTVISGALTDASTSPSD